MERWLRRLCPTWVAKRLEEITPEWLEKQGIRALLLDLDNTLVPWHGMEPTPEAQAWLESLRGAQVAMCLTSNTHRPKRLAAIAEAMAVPFEPGCAKPRPGGILRALQRIGASATEAALVGDQIFTDILGGNCAGVRTVLVPPVSPREFVGTRLVSRTAERWVLRELARRGWLVPIVSEKGGE